MSPPKHIGRFVLRSDEIVVADPGYDEETARIPGLGCFISNCELGEWSVDLITDTTPHRKWKMPRFVIAAHVSFDAIAERTSWKRIGKVGGDSGILGIYDRAHFQDDRIIPEHQKWTFDGGPAIPEMLWYSFNCEQIQGKLVSVIPYGLVTHWDGGMHVESIEQAGRIFAVRLSISGWPDTV